MKKSLSILTAILVMFTMGGSTVFAGNTNAPADDQAAAQETEELLIDDQELVSADEDIAEEPVLEAAEDADADADADADVTEQAAAPAEEPAAPAQQTRKPNMVKAATTAPAPVKNLKAIAGYKQIKLTWTPSAGATSYRIVSNWKTEKGKKKTKTVTVKKPTYTAKADMYTTYTFKVYALKGTAASKAATIKKGCVNRMRIFVTFKMTRYWDDFKIKKGQRIETNGFAGGMYIFTGPDGKRHAVARINVKKPKAEYKSSRKNDKNYTKEEAEFFINRFVKKEKVKSTKKYLIWVSEYNQHVYVFKKKDGKWKATNKNWECSTGKAGSPSPKGKKQIEKKVRSRHGTPYWNCFQGYNAMHGVHSNWGSKLGTIQSSGCIRNPNKRAKWIFNNCPIHTRVIVF